MGAVGASTVLHRSKPIVRHQEVLQDLDAAARVLATCAGRWIGSRMRSPSSPRTLLVGEPRLALEALHPVDCADRAVLSNLGQAWDLAEGFPP